MPANLATTVACEVEGGRGARANFGAFSKLSRSYGGAADDGDRGRRGAEREEASLAPSLIFSFPLSLFHPPLGGQEVDFPPLLLNGLIWI